MVAYFILSFLSGVIELGIILFTIRNGMPLLYIPIMGLAYQIASLFKNPIRLSSRQYLGITMFALALSFFANCTESLLWVFIFTLSIGLQGMRTLASDRCEVTTLSKRISRIFGFATSIFFDYPIFILIPACLLVIFFVDRIDMIRQDAVRINKNFRNDILASTMVIHQSHYFTYAYFVPLLFWSSYNINPVFIGCVFSVGWISYSASHILFRKLFKDKRLLATVLVGHVLTSLALFSLVSYTGNFLASIAAWVLSGLGGGTVFCIRELHELSNKFSSDLDLWENLGHVTGLVVSLSAISIFQDFYYVFAIAGMIALSVAFVATLVLPQKVGY